VPIQKGTLGIVELPTQKGGLFVKIKEIKRLRGDVLEYTAQGTSLIEDEIGNKAPFWMGTNQGERQLFPGDTHILSDPDEVREFLKDIYSKKYSGKPSIAE